MERELDEEMRFHREMLARDNPDLAPRRFGNTTLFQEDSMQTWKFVRLETFLQDVRYGLRMLRRNPGFTAVAALSLALGIGANTAIFTLIDAVMLKMLPVHRPEQLVQFSRVGDFITSTRIYSFSYPAFQNFRKNTDVFAGVFAWTNDFFEVQIDGQTQKLNGIYVSSDFYSTLGVPAVLGRTITAADERVPVAVISYGFWKRGFGLNPAALGKAITLNDVRYTIIGVTPPEFVGIDVGSSNDIAVPITLRSAKLLQQSGSNWLRVIARLKPGITLDQAKAKMSVQWNQLLRDFAPATMSNFERQRYFGQQMDVTPAATGFSYLRQKFSKPLFILMALVGFVLAIACANVANLLLARATARQREMAVRISIGAGRARIIRQLLTESVLLAAIGSALGMGFAYWVSRALVAFISPARSPIVLDLTPDWRVLTFTAGAALLTGILFGLAPALGGTRVQPVTTLKENARGLSHGGARWGMGKALVISQIALSLLLLAGAGLFVHSLRNLETLDPGFERSNVLLVSLNTERRGFRGERAAAFYRQLQAGLATIPGVRSASFSFITPISGGGISYPVSVEGYTPAPNENTEVYVNEISPHFFETLGTPVLQGRDFGPRDDGKAPLVTVVNETFARYYFPRGDAIGKVVTGPPKQSRYTIIGVVKDAKYISLREPIPRTVYFSSLQRSEHMGDRAVEIRVAGKLTGMDAAIQREVHALDANVRATITGTLAEEVNRSLIYDKLIATLSSFFGGLALLLASIGLYGILSYTVTRRTGEIGIRMALGAQRGDVLWLVLREIALLVAAGVAAGVAATAIGARFVASALYGVKGMDPVTLGAAAGLLISVALFAGYLPARRASRVDPMVALRYE
jgi:predicted permease